MFTRQGEYYTFDPFTRKRANAINNVVKLYRDDHIK